MDGCNCASLIELFQVLVPEGSGGLLGERTQILP